MYVYIYLYIYIYYICIFIDYKLHVFYIGFLLFLHYLICILFMSTYADLHCYSKKQYLISDKLVGFKSLYL